MLEHIGRSISGIPRRALPCLAVLVFAGTAHAQDERTVDLESGMTIERSVRVRPGVYSLPAPADTAAAAITIRGDSIVVDMTGAVLRGSAPGTPPDSFAGVAIRVEGGVGVTVRGATARCYKVGLLARDTRGLRLEGNDFSHNWRQRLESGIEGESPAEVGQHELAVGQCDGQFALVEGFV